MYWMVLLHHKLECVPIDRDECVCARVQTEKGLYFFRSPASVSMQGTVAESELIAQVWYHCLYAPDMQRFIERFQRTAPEWVHDPSPACVCLV